MALDDSIAGQVSRSAAVLKHPSQLKLALQDLQQGLQRWPLWVTLGWQDIRQRYRRSMLGPFWLTISMAVLIGVMGFLYAGLFRQDISTYLPYLAAGLMAWGTISTILLDGCVVFSSADSLVKQTKMPYTVHVYRMIWRNLVIFGHNFLVYMVVALIFGVSINLNTLLFIPGLAVVVLNGVWSAIFLGLICARFRDIPQIIASIIRLLFFLTPIMWMPHQIPDKTEFVDFNPFFYFLDILRSPLLGQQPAALSWGLTALITVLGFTGTLNVFCRLRRRIAFWV